MPCSLWCTEEALLVSTSWMPTSSLPVVMTTRLLSLGRTVVQAENYYTFLIISLPSSRMGTVGSHGTDLLLLSSPRALLDPRLSISLGPMTQGKVLYGAWVSLRQQAVPVSEGPHLP